MLSIRLPKTVVSVVDSLFQHLHHIYKSNCKLTFQSSRRLMFPELHLQHCRTLPLPELLPPLHFGQGAPTIQRIFIMSVG